MTSSYTSNKTKVKTGDSPGPPVATDPGAGELSFEESGKAPDEEVFDLSQAILDEINCTILAMLDTGSQTATEIVKQLRLPMTTCYRRLSWLADKGLVKEQLKRPKGRGGPYRLYTSQLQSLSIRYEGSSVKLDVVLSDNPKEPLTYYQRFSTPELSQLGAS